jgi:hypothetical protein
MSTAALINLIATSIPDLNPALVRRVSQYVPGYAPRKILTLSCGKGKAAGRGFIKNI